MVARIKLVLGNALTWEPQSLRREEGQTATEYAVVLGVVVVGLGSTAVVMRDRIIDYINKVGDALAALPFG